MRRGLQGLLNTKKHAKSSSMLKGLNQAQGKYDAWCSNALRNMIYFVNELKLRQEALASAAVEPKPLLATALEKTFENNSEEESVALPERPTKSKPDAAPPSQPAQFFKPSTPALGENKEVGADQRIQSLNLAFLSGYFAKKRDFLSRVHNREKVTYSEFSAFVDFAGGRVTRKGGGSSIVYTLPKYQIVNDTENIKLTWDNESKFSIHQKNRDGGHAARIIPKDRLAAIQASLVEMGIAENLLWPLPSESVCYGASR